MDRISVKILENEAVLNIKEGKIKKAEQILEKILERNQSNTKVLNLLGLCKYSYCRFDLAFKIWTISYEIDNNLKAKEYLKEYNTVDEQKVQQIFKDVLHKVKSKQYESAKVDLEKILIMNNSLIPPKILIANIFANKNKIKEIYEVLEIYDVDSSNIIHHKFHIQILEKLLNLTMKSEMKTLTVLMCMLWIIAIAFIVVMIVI